ncbi:VOC family protein [Streptomyces sp. NPDC004838]
MAVFPEGAPCWVDAALPDVEAGRRFYGGLFGWTFRQENGDPYVDALSDGKLVAALAPKSDGRMPTVWNVYFATPDAVALSRRIESEGGRLIVPPRRVGTLGGVAVAADPGGAVFGLWQAGERVGFEKQARPGSFCWTEVYTWDKERADPFYETVFGFTGTDLRFAAAPGAPADAAPSGEAAEADIRVWSPRGAEPGEDTAVGGRCVLTEPAFPAELPDHFLVYFCVKDCDATVAAAIRLGGRVQARPFDIPHGRIAVLTDDQGATFAVLAEPRADTGTEKTARSAEAPEDPEAPEDDAADAADAADTEDIGSGPRPVPDSG